jgi:hypothetical protein
MIVRLVPVWMVQRILWLLAEGSASGERAIFEGGAGLRSDLKSSLAEVRRPCFDT